MTKDEALKLALEALKRATNYDPVIARAITAIKEALAQPEREPVACKECHLKDLVYDLLGDLKVANLKLSVRAKRTWVGLTDIDYAGLPLEQVGLVRWAEAKLKEKNT